MQLLRLLAIAHNSLSRWPETHQSLVVSEFLSIACIVGFSIMSVFSVTGGSISGWVFFCKFLQPRPAVYSRG